MKDQERFIRKAFELAVTSGKKGNATFGAVLVHNEMIIATAENTAITGDGYGHAEYNLAMKSALEIPENILRDSTFYASTAPCRRCALSMLALGVKRIVIGVSYERFQEIVPVNLDSLPIHEIARRLDCQDVEILGPILEDEGMKVFEYWGGDYKPLEELLEKARKGRERSKKQ